MTAREIIDMYISFFEKRGHKQIPNAPIIPQDDPTTLFTSAGMQPLVPYLLGKEHPAGKRLVNVQNCFRAQDIEEIGDNRHTTFFRMIGNWSLGDYFKKEQIPWFFEFLTTGLGLDPKRLYVSVFNGYKKIPRDEQSAVIWKELFEDQGINPEGRIFFYGTDENWWSRAGEPENMPLGEPGGPDSEVFFDFYPDQGSIGTDLKKYSHNGRLLEIGNSVFMQYLKTQNGFSDLPNKNVDFGGGLERLMAAVDLQQDVFQTNLFAPIIASLEKHTKRSYKKSQKHMRIIADHFIGASFIADSGILPANKSQGYVLRRLLRRGFDHWYELEGSNITSILEAIVEQYKETDPQLVPNFERIKGVILEEEQLYKKTRDQAKKAIDKDLRRIGTPIGDELKGSRKISAEIAFKAISSYGLSPTQLKSLGYLFDQQELAEKIKEHQAISGKSAKKKFA